MNESIHIDTRFNRVIGVNTLDVIRNHPDRFRVINLAVK